MEAANRGAHEGGGFSVGFIIELPHEKFTNLYLDLSVKFHHFFARKVMFVKAAEGFVIFPGGFGTVVEMFEALQNAEFAVVPGTSHFLTQEKPHLVNALLMDFLTNEPVATVAPIRRAPRPD